MVRPMAATGSTGVRIIEIDSNWFLVSITTGERVNVALLPKIVAETKTYFSFQTSAAMLPKRFSIRTWPPDGISMRIPSSADVLAAAVTHGRTRMMANESKLNESFRDSEGIWQNAVNSPRSCWQSLPKRLLHSGV